MTFFMDVNIWMIVGFLLAAYSVVANDSLQTLGTYISSNKKRTPKVVQMLFVCTVTIVVLMMGWFLKDGDPAWGRLSVPGKEFLCPSHSTGSTSFRPLRCWLSPSGALLSVPRFWCCRRSSPPTSASCSTAR